MAGCRQAPSIRAIVWDYNIVDDGVLRAVRDRGWANYVYGAITAGGHSRCAGLGPAGLITDHPELLLC